MGSVIYPKPVTSLLVSALYLDPVPGQSAEAHGGFRFPVGSLLLPGEDVQLGDLASAEKAGCQAERRCPWRADCSIPGIHRDFSIWPALLSSHVGF